MHAKNQQLCIDKQAGTLIRKFSHNADNPILCYSILLIHSIDNIYNIFFGGLPAKQNVILRATEKILMFLDLVRRRHGRYEHILLGWTY